MYYKDDFEEVTSSLFITRVVIAVVFLFVIFTALILTVAAVRIETIEANKEDPVAYESTQELLSEIEEEQNEY